MAEIWGCGSETPRHPKHAGSIGLPPCHRYFPGPVLGSERGRKWNVKREVRGNRAPLGSRLTTLQGDSTSWVGKYFEY